MKISILDYILYPDESIHEKIKPSREYEKLDDEGYKVYTDLREMLNAEQRKLFDRLDDIQMEQKCESNETYFKEGVKFGVRLMLECLSD